MKNEDAMRSETEMVWVTVSATVNLGNYENVKIEMGTSRACGGKSNPATVVRNELLQELMDEVTKTANEVRPEKRGRERT